MIMVHILYDKHGYIWHKHCSHVGLAHCICLTHVQCDWWHYYELRIGMEGVRLQSDVWMFIFYIISITHFFFQFLCVPIIRCIFITIVVHICVLTFTVFTLSIYPNSRDMVRFFFYNIHKGCHTYCRRWWLHWNHGISRSYFLWASIH